jgi:hypothetical protein
MEQGIESPGKMKIALFGQHIVLPLPGTQAHVPLAEIGVAQKKYVDIVI